MKNVPVSFTMRLGGPEPRNPLTIYHQAVGFYFAGHRCLLDIPIGPKTSQSLVAPSIVNFVFSIELFLKSILIKSENNPQKTHKIMDLMMSCPKNVTDRIREEYELVVKDPSFDKIIFIVNDMFVQVRYQYEYNVNVLYDSAVIALARSLYIVCDELYTEY